MNSKELKRCPLCGKTVNVEKWSRALYFIQCKGCGCEVERETEDEVITAWNTRFEDVGEVDMDKVSDRAYATIHKLQALKAIVDVIANESGEAKDNIAIIEKMVMNIEKGVNGKQQ